MTTNTPPPRYHYVGFATYRVQDPGNLADRALLGLTPARGQWASPTPPRRLHGPVMVVRRRATA